MRKYFAMSGCCSVALLDFGYITSLEYGLKDRDEDVGLETYKVMAPAAIPHHIPDHNTIFNQK